MASRILSQAQLKELLHYDPITGVFTWKQCRGRQSAGSVAGALCHGYIRIHLDGKNYAAHRLAWLWVHGCWPENEIDHIDRNRANNSIQNLREATRGQNAQNMTLKAAASSRFRGVHFSASRAKWVAQIRINGRAKHLGIFENEIDAAAAAEAARVKHYTHSPFNQASVKAIGGAA
jgi:hypothetical protein